MMTVDTALELITKGLAPALAETGFKAARLPAEPGIAVFTGDAGTLRIELTDDRVALGACERPLEEALDGEFDRLSLALLELEGAGERDCKYIADDFAEEILKKFRRRRAGQLATAGKKPPKSVSKTAIRNGDAYYDALSFGNSFSSIYPELRGEFKANYEKYGEFLAEDFFLAVGNQAVRDTISRNNPAQMKRLFNLLNDVYGNGVNDVQSLVCVTILGSLDNDPVLLARCADYMSADLAPVVIRVNKYLSTAAGKKARQKLDNPPLYKPKKAKKPGLMQQLMGGGGGGGMPGM